METAQRDIDSQIRRGAPAGKIVLGVPFYGRSLTDWSQLKGFGEINRIYAPGRSQDEAGGFWFNSAATLERKVAIAKERGLAGVLVWELGQDASGEASLLRAIVAASKSAVTEEINPRPTPIDGRRSQPNPIRASTKNEKPNRRTIKSIRPAPKPGPRKSAAKESPVPSRPNSSVSRSGQVVKRTAKPTPKRTP